MSAHPNGGFSLLTSVRFDKALRDANATLPDSGPYWLLSYHLDRLRTAAHSHGWSRAAQITMNELRSACDSAVESYGSDPVKRGASVLRISVHLTNEGSLQTAIFPLQYKHAWHPLPAPTFDPQSKNPSNLGPILTIVLDSQATYPSVFTSTKTTHRKNYDAARSRAASALGYPLPDDHDVLLYNLAGEVMETSIRNVAFRRDGQWVVPPTSTGCLPGVARRYLLEQGNITELAPGHALTINDLADGEWLLLFNAVRGCQLGRLTLP